MLPKLLKTPWQVQCQAQSEFPCTHLYSEGLCSKNFPGGSDGKESACNARDLGSIPGFGRSPGEGKGYPLQYSCLENPMDRGAWRATVQRSQKVRQDWVSKHTPLYYLGYLLFLFVLFYTLGLYLCAGHCFWEIIYRKFLRLKIMLSLLKRTYFAGSWGH